MTAATPLARYSAVEGALASGFATAQLHHAAGHDLFLCTRQPPTGEDVSERAAKELGIEFERISRLDEALAGQLGGLGADIGLMAYVTLRAHRAFLSLPRLGTIQFHPSLLPKYRGPSAINWAIINGERNTGISIFRPNEVFDDGELLFQQAVAISDNESAGELYRNRLMPLGVGALVECAECLDAGTLFAQPQDRSQATYQGWCSSDNARIDWRLAANHVHNLIRGCDPKPGAWTLHKGKVLAICRSRVSETRAGNRTDAMPPGAVVAVQHDRILLSCGTGFLEIMEVRSRAGQRTPISALITSEADRKLN